MAFTHLKKRSDFLAASKRGHSFARKSFVMQFFVHTQEEKKDQGLRFGFTASKKVGNAVRRNRCKRRLRSLVELSLLALSEKFSRPTDIVFIARHRTFDLPFSQLEKDLADALTHIKV